MDSFLKLMKLKKMISWSFLRVIMIKAKHLKIFKVLFKALELKIKSAYKKPW